MISTAVIVFSVGVVVGGMVTFLVPVVIMELAHRFMATDWEAEPEATELKQVNKQ